MFYNSIFLRKITIFFIFCSTFLEVIAQSPSSDFLLNTDYIPKYYRLEMNLNPNQSNFSGKTTMHFQTTSVLNQIQIHAQPNLTIESITYHSQNIDDYSHDGNILNFNLPVLLPANKLDSVSISFSGNASTSNGLTLGTHAEVPVIETLAEPWHASSWWVCKDDLLEKVEEIDVYIQHPTEFKAASNGSLQSVTDLGNGNSLTFWKHNYPIPAYLIGIAVTNYVEYNTSVNVGGIEMPIINYMYPETLSDWTDALDEVSTYIEFFSEKFGDYPFKNEKYGHAQWNRSGGMEHTTMSFMGKFTFNLIAHELAHQWFGNKVTCASWNDIWINEGFADYSAGLLTEHIQGDETFKEWKEIRIGQITAQNDGSVYVPNANSQSRVFDSRLTYKKASMVVHLIRFMLNDDELFLEILRNFLDHPDFSFSYASTQDFKQVLEATTQQNWGDYFDEWIYGEGHPIFTISLAKLPDSNTLILDFQQTTSHNSVEFFKTPFEIEFQGENNQKEIRRFNLTQSEQSFVITDLPFEVVSYLPNPGFDVICEVHTTNLLTTEWDEKDLQIYPNPVKKNLTIESSKPIKFIEVFSTSGQKIKEIPVQNQFKTQIQNWKKGVYILKISFENSSTTKKIIVE